MALNGLTAILGIAGILFFALSLRALGCRDYVLAALALAFTPIVFINSTTSMDYIWALTFVMAGLYFAIVRRPLIAGLMIGLAIGCRITSGAMLVPLALILVRDNEGSYSPKRVAQLAIVACLVGTAAFVPVTLPYGPGFFAFYEQQYPSAFVVLKGMSEDLWGVVGSLAITAALISLLFPAGRAVTGGSIPRASGKLYTAAWVAAVVIYFAGYLRLPYEPAYLIPAIPFVLILLGRFLNRKVFIAVCIALVASPLVLSVGQKVDDEIAYGDRYESDFAWELKLDGHWFVEPLGPIFVEHNRRLAGQAYVEGILEAADLLEERSLIVAGQWLPRMLQRVGRGEGAPSSSIFSTAKDSKGTVTPAIESSSYPMSCFSTRTLTKSTSHSNSQKIFSIFVRISTSRLLTALSGSALSGPGLLSTSHLLCGR